MHYHNFLPNISLQNLEVHLHDTLKKKKKLQHLTLNPDFIRIFLNITNSIYTKHLVTRCINFFSI